ncbi:hypothetical protein [Salinirarus marinus]|uniref:hypothetical protein n=1 Tax=Salinirarus marinus TaxID=3068310 RepID=UPI003C6CC486
MEVATGFTIIPGGGDSTEDEIRRFYENHYSSGAVASGDIWPMYPKEGDIPPLASYNYRHPGQFFENEN